MFGEQTLFNVRVKNIIKNRGSIMSKNGNIMYIFVQNEEGERAKQLHQRHFFSPFLNVTTADFRMSGIDGLEKILDLKFELWSEFIEDLNHEMS